MIDRSRDSCTLRTEWSGPPLHYAAIEARPRILTITLSKSQLEERVFSPGKLGKSRTSTASHSKNYESKGGSHAHFSLITTKLDPALRKATEPSAKSLLQKVADWTDRTFSS